MKEEHTFEPSPTPFSPTDGGGVEPQALRPIRLATGDRPTPGITIQQRRCVTSCMTAPHLSEGSGPDPQAQRLHPLSRRGSPRRRLYLPNFSGRRWARPTSPKAPPAFKAGAAPDGDFIFLSSQGRRARTSGLAVPSRALCPLSYTLPFSRLQPSAFILHPCR